MRRVEVKKSRIHGNGLFAQRSLAMGEIIPTGHVCRQHAYGGINHSCRPNAILVCPKGMYQILVITRRVRPGAEVTVNYERFGLRRNGTRRFKCRCPGCRRGR